MNKAVFSVVYIVLLSSILLSQEAQDYNRYWPQWRGPLANGVAPHGTPPLKWSESQNIRWKVEIPGNGHATPIIWQDQIFIQTAIPSQGDRLKFTVLSINRKDGKTLWQKTASDEAPHEGHHRTATFASSSPITDGKNLYAYFGSRGLYCYDLSGNLKWEKDLGDMQIRRGFGEGSSPALYKNTLVVNWDHEGQSFITALDKNTGKQLWKTQRDEGTTWVTPLIVESEGKPIVVVPATTTRAYDLKSGELLWEVDGMTVNAIPSPVKSNGTIFVMSGFRGSMLQAIKLDGASGNLANSGHILWEHDRDTPYVPSPLLYDNYLYFVKVNRGVLTCIDAETGNKFYGPIRLEAIDNIYASLVGADDKVYIVSREGSTMVLKKDAEFEVLAENKLDDGIDASPAIVGNEIYLRGHNYLYCISEN